MDRPQGLSAGVQEVALKINLISVIENGIEVNTGKRYCYKTVQKKYLVGSDFCRVFCLPDSDRKILDTVEEAVDYLLEGRSGQAE